MKVNLSEVDLTQFRMREGTIAGERVVLIAPKDAIDVNWTPDNLIFRSSVWDTEGNLISASFPKFFNTGEATSLVSDPLLEDFSKSVIVDKIDGSCLIVSKYKGNLITRTRGTLTTDVHPNGGEIYVLLEKYPRIAEYITEEFSLLFEWTTPTRRIVINYGQEPDLSLIGLVRHNDYSLATQKELDTISIELGVKRPKTWSIDEESLDSFKQQISASSGIEGVCIYYNNDQTIKKLKSFEYLEKSRLKQHISLANTLSLFMTYEEPTKEDFLNTLKQTYDFELMLFISPFVDKVCEARDSIITHIAKVKESILPLRLVDRKSAAAHMMANMAPEDLPIGFLLLDGRDINTKLKLKLYERFLNLL